MTVIFAIGFLNKFIPEFPQSWMPSKPNNFVYQKIVGREKFFLDAKYEISKIQIVGLFKLFFL